MSEKPQPILIIKLITFRLRQSKINILGKSTNLLAQYLLPAEIRSIRRFVVALQNLQQGMPAIADALQVLLGRAARSDAGFHVLIKSLSGA